MRTLIGFFFLFSAVAFAAEVSREEASGIIDEMVKSSMISAEEGAKAKARLLTMSAPDWTKLNKEAEQKALELERRAPASVSVAGPGSDLGEEQFAAIESDLKVIAPHSVVVPRVMIEETKVSEISVPQVVIPHTVVPEVKVSETFVPKN